MALHVQQASPAGQGMRRLAGALTPPEQSPSEALQDMRLPPRAIEYLRAPLSALGMEVREGIIQVRRGAERVHSVIGDGEQRCIVLHIAHWILDNPTDAKDAALASLAWAFEEGTELFIVSEGLDIIPARAYRRMILEQWPSRLGVRATFVPWTDIRNLGGPAAQEDLKEILGLESASRPAPAAHSVADMEIEEVRELARIVAGTPDFLDARGRSVMAELAGLGGVLSGFDFTGRPTVVAGDLVSRLQRHGEVREGHHALGMLLDYLCGLDDMPRETVAFMESVILKYKLVPR